MTITIRRGEWTTILGTDGEKEIIAALRWRNTTESKRILGFLGVKPENPPLVGYDIPMYNSEGR